MPNTREPAKRPPGGLVLTEIDGSRQMISKLEMESACLRPHRSGQAAKCAKIPSGEMRVLLTEKNSRRRAYGLQGDQEVCGSA